MRIAPLERHKNSFFDCMQLIYSGPIWTALQRRYSLVGSLMLDSRTCQRETGKRAGIPGRETKENKRHICSEQGLACLGQGEQLSVTDVGA